MAAQKIRKGSPKAQPSTEKGKKPSSPTKGPASTEKLNDLRAGVLALGGDEDDYALLKDLESDDTQEFSDHETEVKTTKEIAAFLKTLDFKGHKKAVVVDDVKASNDREAPSTSKLPAPPVPAKEPPKPVDNAVKKQLAAARSAIPASSQWYAFPLPALSPPTTPLPEVAQSELTAIRAKAQAMHASLPPPPSTSSSKSDEQFIANVLASGTLSDRLSALTLLAQSSPIHNVRALESLKAMASKKGREESLKACRAIVDWWVGGGAPDRKLKYFADQPVNHPQVTDNHLLLWYFEDWLKKYFFNVLQLLEALSVDLLPYVRMQAMTLIFQLIDGKPEQEQNLLRLLVNKLGDSEKTVASKASYQLLQLLQHHPGMKAIVVREVSSLLFRPVTSSAASAAAKSKPAKSKGTPKASESTSSAATGVNIHARYYSIITLNQMTLSASDADAGVARLLVDLYFRLFKDMLNEGAKAAKGEKRKEKEPVVDDAEADEDPQGGRGRRDRKGKGKGKAETSESIAVGAGFAEVEDADSRTISAILSGVNRAMPFAKGGDDSLFDDHIDTLFRITHTATFNISVQALMLILQVTSAKQTVSDRFYRTLYESIFDPRLITSSKQAMYLNLLFKAVKADNSHPRVCAFVKRILQSLGSFQPPFICGALYMLGQLVDLTPGLKAMIRVPHPNEPSKTEPAPATEKGNKKRKAAEAVPETEPVVEEDTTYDARKRDPQYAHAENSCLWELIPLLNHFHPSVSLHAQQILTSVQVTATPDLALNTLSHFLDRFVYKNPKKPKPRGASAMQPGAMEGGDGAVRLVRGGISGLTLGSEATGKSKKSGAVGTVNEEGFWSKKAEEVPVDQLFFHRFFLNKLDKQKEKNKKVAKRKKGSDDEGDSDSDDGEAEGGASGSEAEEGNDEEVEVKEDGNEDEDEDDDEGTDEEEEAEIWRVMQETMPGPKADLDLMEDDSDDLPSGLSDLDSDSDDEGSEAESEENAVEADGGEDDEDDVDAAASDEDGSGVSEFAEDDEDLIDLDDEAPEDIPFLSAFEPEDSEAVSGKRKPTVEDTQKGGRKRRKLGQLPTFASYEDYAKLIEEGPEDDI